MNAISNYFKTVLSVFLKIFEFFGKSNRKEYWIYLSFVFVISFCVGVVSELIVYENGQALTVYDWVVDFTTLALVVRRLRDAGIIVWVAVVAFLPYTAIVIPAVIIIGCLPSKKYDWGTLTNTN